VSSGPRLLPNHNLIFRSERTRTLRKLPQKKSHCDPVEPEKRITRIKLLTSPSPRLDVQLKGATWNFGQSKKEVHYQGGSLPLQ